jgi:hypothetical protein
MDHPSRHQIPQGRHGDVQRYEQALHDTCSAQLLDQDGHEA